MLINEHETITHIQKKITQKIPQVIDIAVIIDQQSYLFVVPSENSNLQLLTQQIIEVYPEINNNIFYINLIPLTQEGEINKNMLLSLASREMKIKSLQSDDVSIINEYNEQDYIDDYHFSDFEALLNPVIEDNRNSSKNYEENINKTIEQLALVEHQQHPLDSLKMGLTKSLNEALISAARVNPRKKINYYIDDNLQDQLYYDELLTNAKKVLGGLKTIGIQKGDIVILQSASLKLTHQIFWGCLLGGIIFVNISTPPVYDLDNNVVKKLIAVWQHLGYPKILAEDTLIVSLEKLLIQIHPTVNILDATQLLNSSESQDIMFQDADSVVFIQLSSGSTGVSKCIQITNGGILEHVAASTVANNYNSNDVTLNWLPFDHVVPILTFHLKNIVLGCEQYEIPHQKILSNPLLWLKLIDKYKITHTWSPNFGFKLLAGALKNVTGLSLDLASLKYFMNAGEQVTYNALESFYNLAKQFNLNIHALQPAFGMAEACTCMTYNNDFDFTNSVVWIDKSSLQNDLRICPPFSEHAISFIKLGMPSPGVAIRIVDDNNNVLPECRIGRFQIKGNVITPGYLNNEDANHKSFVGDGWFDSGDLGFIKNGHLVLTGRVKETIIIYGANFYCHELEDAIDSIDNITATYSAVCGIPDHANGTESLAIFFVPVNFENAALSQTIKNIKAMIVKNFGTVPKYILPLTLTEFPKTTSGKIQRIQLRARLINGGYQELIKKSDKLLGDNIFPAWFFSSIQKRKMIPVTTKNLMIPENSQLMIFTDNMDIINCFNEYLRKTTIASHLFLFSNVNIIPNSKSVTILSSDLDRNLNIMESVNLCSDNLLVLCLFQHQSTNLWEHYDVLLTPVKILISILKFITILQNNASNKRCDLVVCNRPDTGVPMYATLPSIVQTINREFTSIHAKHLEYENIVDADTVVPMILNELQDTAATVHYKNNIRTIPQFITFNPLDYIQNNSAIKRDGFYIVIGGLGGVGYHICEYLLRKYNVKLLIIGRSQLLNGKTQHHNRYTKLKSVSDKVDYLSTLDHDLESSSLILEKHQESLEGVIYLAGSYYESFLLDETVEQINQCSHDKISGIITATKLLLKLNPQGLFITFSSVLSQIANAKIGIYSCINGFADAWCNYLNSQTTLKSYAFSWSNWGGIGMSKSYRTPPSNALMNIDIEKGLLSFEALLHCPPGLYYIGLNPKSTSITAKSSLLCCSASKYTIIYDSNKIHSKQLEIAHNVNLATTIISKDEYKIQNSSTGLHKNKHLNYTEQRLEGIWKKLLLRENINIDSSFFELGGNSILLANMISLVENEFDLKLSLQDVFTYSNIALLAKYIDNKDNSKFDFCAAKQRAQLRKKNHIPIGV